MNDYKIVEIMGTFPAQFGKTRVAFRVEGNPNQVSGFFQRVPNVGDVLHGDIVQKGQYFNFQFPKKESSFQAPAAGISSVEYQTILRDLQAIKTDTQLILGKLGQSQPTYPTSRGGTAFDQPF